MREYLSKQKVLISLFIGLMATGVAMQYISNAKSDIQSSVVRLHVIANSNSAEDQQLKLKVRDAVIAYLKDKLDNAQSTQETKEIIDFELQSIANAALAEVSSNGYSYDINAQLGRFEFPTKKYGKTQLPKGEYDALRIVIGDGAGENWWCVLFPQLCFTSSQGAELTEEGKKQLKNVLTEDEYNILTSSQEGSIPVKIKFRLLELFKE